MFRDPTVGESEIIRPVRVEFASAIASDAAKAHVCQ